MGSDGWQKAWDSEWKERIPGIMFCGLVSGLGGLLGTLAFAWSAGSSSALLSMIENGAYTVTGALFIALYYQEHPRPQAYAGFALIMLGVLLAQRSSSTKMKDLDKGQENVAFCESESQETYSESSAIDSEAEESLDAPTSKRMWSLGLAVVAGTCWGFGPLGKKMGVHQASEEQKRDWSTCTYFVYIMSTILIPMGRMLCSTAEHRSNALRDRHFRWLLCGTTLCGFLSGCGGLVSTFAFSQEAYFSGALVSTVENGVYTVFGALLITVLFKEHLSWNQCLSALLVLAGILVVGMDFRWLAQLLGI